MRFLLIVATLFVTSLVPPPSLASISGSVALGTIVAVQGDQIVRNEADADKKKKKKKGASGEEEPDCDD